MRLRNIREWKPSNNVESFDGWRDARHFGSVRGLGTRRIHLRKESDLTVQNHIDWRIKMTQHLQQEGVGENVHYLAVLGLSKDAIQPMLELLMKTVKESEHIVDIPGADHLCMFNLDFVVM